MSTEGGYTRQGEDRRKHKHTYAHTDTHTHTPGADLSDIVSLGHLDLVASRETGG